MAPQVIVANQQDVMLRAIVERCTFGFTLTEWALAKALGPSGYVEYHLAADMIDDSALSAKLQGLPSLGWSPQETLAHTTTNHPVQELKHAAILRAVYSKRQLFERVVEFFTDHFNIYIKDGSVRMLKPTDDRDVIRKHAFGKFSELLRASMRSAAMLMFLDNDQNTKEGPNENYARELMELHTLGVDGGYTETDVKEAARCLTGWSFWPLGSGAFGVFTFNAAAHDQGAKQVLGQSFPANQGIADGDQLAQLLLSHPATPRFVGGKLARHLLRYEPSSELVERIVETWQQTDGDIKSIVRIILAEKTLLQEAPWTHRKLRRPFAFAAWLLRVTHAEIPQPASLMTPGPLTQELRILGQEPYDWPMPNGYPDSVAAWGTGLYGRWSFASRLLDGSLAGASVDANAIVADLAGTGILAPGVAISEMLSGGRMTDKECRILDSYASSAVAPRRKDIAEWIALAASCESMQYV
jgi:uncharacterized protein (DUF1800 family)